MKILIHLGHPAHFHMFKNVLTKLKQNKNTVFVAIKTKDILEDLLIKSGISYINLWHSGRKNNSLNNIIGLLMQNIRLLVYCIMKKPDILIGTSAAITHVGKLLSIPSLYFGEDDAWVVPKASKMSLPYATWIMSPNICSKGKWDFKKIGYSGFQKLTYLHPNYFKADRNVIEKYFSMERPYYLIRFAKLNAHHDNGVKGLNNELAQKIIELLEKRGNVYISSERELPIEFEKYRLNINPLDIHHVMAFATLYIGDSQSMSVEAAMLGTPSIRFNDFAGKISVLNELETKYELTYGIHSSEPDKLFAILDELLAFPDLKEVFQQRRQQMLSEKIDVTAFFTWFIENYPESAQIMRSNPDYQYRFK